MSEQTTDRVFRLLAEALESHAYTPKQRLQLANATAALVPVDGSTHKPFPDPKLAIELAQVDRKTWDLAYRKDCRHTSTVPFTAEDEAELRRLRERSTEIIESITCPDWYNLTDKENDLAKIDRFERKGRREPLTQLELVTVAMARARIESFALKERNSPRGRRRQRYLSLSLRWHLEKLSEDEQMELEQLYAEFGSPKQQRSKIAADLQAFRASRGDQSVFPWSRKARSRKG